MGLTGNKSANSFLTSLADFKKEIKDELEKINSKLEALEKIAFQEVILEEKDTSWEVIRKKRDYLLRSTDWVMTSGSTIHQSEWAEYRQILRDLPQTYFNLPASEVVWPKQPLFTGPNTTQLE